MLKFDAGGFIKNIILALSKVCTLNLDIFQHHQSVCPTLNIVTLWYNFVTYGHTYIDSQLTISQ